MDLLFQHARGHACAAVCLAGERHSPWPVRLVSALLGPGVGRARELYLVGSLHRCQYCAALLEMTSMSRLGPALPCTAFPPLSLTPSKGFLPASPCFLQVVAGFSFAARSPQEVSLQAGQPVVVLEPHDKKGSKEWSLVEVNGQRGYVPSSYLMTVPVQEPTGWSLPV